jgi:hypothetical protein
MSASLLTVLLAGPAVGQLSLEACKTLISQGQFSKAAQELLALRERRNGRDADISYYIGFCLCRDGKPNDGRAWLEYGKKQVDKPQRSYFEDVIRQCGQSVPVTFIAQPAGRSNLQPGVTSRAKGGWFFGGKDVVFHTDDPAAGAALNIVSISADTLRKRLFTANQRSAALTEIAKSTSDSLGKEYSVSSAGQFTFVTRGSGWQREQLAQLENVLERVMSFYKTEFRMLSPEHLVTLYLAGSHDELNQMARQIHGMPLSIDVIGYSTYDDLSIAALSTGPQRWGTIAHELFHLMVRGNFGDIPTWLEEGMASAYSVASFDGNKLIASKDNWRAAILREFYNSGDRTTVKDLLNLGWDDLSGGDNTEQQIRGAVRHALICYLVVYLQEKGKLADVYAAYRNRIVPAELTDETLPLERALGRPVAEIDHDFKDFLRFAIPNLRR